MKPLRLGEVPYFRIPPYVTRSELEFKLDGIGLLSNELVRAALDEAELSHCNDTPRNSGASVLEEHIYPTARLVLEYQIFEHSKGNQNFREINPNGVIVGLLHEKFDDIFGDREEFERKYGREIFEMVLILGDERYIRQGAKDYREKTQMKFEALKKAPWQAQAAGLADRVNNTLCFYTEPYLDNNRNPTKKMKRAISIVTDIALPVADIVSPDFFAPMLLEELNYYKRMYPAVFGNLRF